MNLNGHSGGIAFGVYMILRIGSLTENPYLIQENGFGKCVLAKIGNIKRETSAVCAWRVGINNNDNYLQTAGPAFLSIALYADLGSKWAFRSI